jgi:SAM-dependent methyltransferase
MHDTAHDIGRRFFEMYFAVPPIAILEIGSLDVNGTLRDCAPAGSAYTGVDLAPGRGVDIVLEDPHSLPFADERYDAVVSSSCLEHDPMFWATFIEMVRVAKTSGYIYINAPSNGSYHAYPADNWRFYPDAPLALTAWAHHRVREIELIESFVARRKADQWNDCVMVFRKGLGRDALHRRIVDRLPGSCNIRRSAAGKVENLTVSSEDMLLLDATKAQLAASEREVARLTGELHSLQASLGGEASSDVRWIGFDC